MQRAILAIVLAIACLPALAVGKVTTDPNTPGAAAKPDSDTDARLAQRVTIVQAAKPVRVVLADLTKLTGITFKAGYNNGDWQVRDRKMSIFATDVPLVQIMNSISRVMKFKWSRKPSTPGVSGSERSGNPETPAGGNWTYRLYMDRRTLLDAEAQRARAEAKEEAEQARKRQNALDQFGKLSSLSAADRAKLKTDNPFMYMAAETGWGDSLAAFLREVPAASEALAGGQKINLEGASLSPAARSGLLSAMQAELDIETRFNSGHASYTPRTLPAGLDPAKISIAINERMDMMTNMPTKGMFLGWMKFSYDGGSVSTPFINPDSDLIKLIGKVFIESDEQNRKIDDVVKDRMNELVAIVTKEVKSEAGGEPVNEHADDPALKNKVKLKAGLYELPYVEQDLAEASKFAVVSDQFGGMSMIGMTSMSPSAGVPAGETELKTALDKIADSYIYNWDKRGEVIELRDRNWFKKRAAQIPDAWLEKWRNELNTTGTIDIDNLAQIAQLTQEQFSANVMFDEVLRGCDLTSVVMSNREVLRFYALLSPDQRALLLSEPGLVCAALASDQLDQLAKLLQTKKQDGLLASDKRLVIACTRTPVQKDFAYSVRLSADGKPECEWSVTTPSSYGIPAQAKPPVKPADKAGAPSETKPADAPSPTAPAK